MPQLSARHMYLAKWLLPILTFVGVAIWTFAKKMPRTATELVSYGFALTVLACFLIYFLRRDIRCLADDVLDGGAFLIVRLLADVVGIDVTHQLNATRIVLQLRVPGVLGDKLEFFPKVSHPWGGRNEIADDLAARIGRFQTAP